MAVTRIATGFSGDVVLCTSHLEVVWMQVVFNCALQVVSHEIRSPLHGMIGLAASMMELVTNDGMKRQWLDSKENEGCSATVANREGCRKPDQYSP